MFNRNHLKLANKKALFNQQKQFVINKTTISIQTMKRYFNRLTHNNNNNKINSYRSLSNNKANT